MLYLKAVLQQLERKRTDLQNQIERLDTAIATLSGLRGKDRRGGRRHLSAAARNRIADAQQKRWAKWKAKRNK